MYVLYQYIHVYNYMVYTKHKNRIGNKRIEKKKKRKCNRIYDNIIEKNTNEENSAENIGIE